MFNSIIKRPQTENILNVQILWIKHDKLFHKKSGKYMHGSMQPDEPGPLIYPGQQLLDFDPKAEKT